MPGRVNTRLVKRAGKKILANPRVRMQTNKMFETATKSLKEAAFKKAEETAIDGLERLTQDFALKIKTPIGVNGRNLNLFKSQLLDQPAIGGTTESTSMFSYRPKRASKTTDTLTYKAIRNKSYPIVSTAGSQIAVDRNLALLEPPNGDNIESATSYTNFSIRNEFDKMLLARVKADGVEQDTLKTTLIAHYHSLSSVMILRAPEQGAIVDIYDLQPKFAIGPGTYQNEARADDHISPQWCWATGLGTTVSIQTQDTYADSNVGADPMTSPTFRRTWNIIKKTTVRMTSNAVHRHRSVFNINKSVTYDEMAQCSTQGGTAPWLPTQMVVVRGYPSATSLAEAVTVTCQQESTLSYSSRLAQTTNVIVFNNNT